MARRDAGVALERGQRIDGTDVVFVGRTALDRVKTRGVLRDKADGGIGGGEVEGAGERDRLSFRCKRSRNMAYT